MRTWAVAAAAGLWLAGTCAADEALDAWLAAYPAKLDALQTVREKGELRIEMDMGGMQSRNVVELEFIYRRPDGLVAKGMFMDLYCLGTNATTYQAMKNEYRRETVAGLAELLADYRMQMLMLTADKKALLEPDADGRAAALEEFFASEDARRLPDEELAGRTCAVFVDRRATPLYALQSWTKIWVDAETGLLRRMEGVPKPDWAADDDAADDDDVARALRDMKVSYEATEQRVNEPIPDEAFVFAPPEGATEDVPTPEEEETEELVAEGQRIQEAAGLDRFELSGQAAPDFELPLLDGGTFRMSEQKGKTVVLAFWATWCAPSVRPLGPLQRLADGYAGQADVAVVGFSTDDEENRAKVAQLAERKKLGFALGLGPVSAKEAYQVRSVPTVVVVGPDGTVQGRRIGHSAGLEKDLKRAVDAVRAGETLASAQPYTAEELKRLAAGLCPRCGRRHGAGAGRDAAAMDAGAFRLRWSREVQAGDAARTPGMGLERVVAAIPPRAFLRLDGAKAVRVDAASGEILSTTELPAEMCATNEQGQVPELVYVRSAAGDAIVGYQERYTVTKKGTSTSFRNRRTDLFGMRLPAGEVWRKKLGEDESLRSLFAVPVAADEDVLVAAFWNELRFLDGEGRTVLEQKLDYRTQATFALDAAGKPVVYLLGKKIELYELVWPPAAPAGEPEAPAAEDAPAAE